MTSSAGLRIGFVPGVTLTKWRRIWGERFHEPLDVVEVTEEAQRRAVVDGEVDMCFARLPIDKDGLHVIPLYDEQPVLWLSKDHILAALDEITAEDLADDGTRVIYDASLESIDLATYSAAVLRVPMSIARSGSRKDMIYLPLVDAEPTTVGLAWRVDNEHPLIEEFIGVVRGRTVNSTRTAQAKGDEPAAKKGRQAKAGSKPAARRGGRAKASTKGPRRR
ncbi:LysR family transcriptional regulator substrate-binding protein [Tessaracoccus massiliensis]|uniref:LysR family transcriptional regulator substrate-binding protein n=1 Tax=Tessaracoccus massiliensis TaxID=1522311 RepID=UPI000591012D|nr:LysR family transcriptional regulator substrate-binding protein [Tessaracoccus massiliensis]